MRTFAQKQNDLQQQSSTELTKPNASTPAAQEAHPLVDMQRTIGNQAIVQFLQTHDDRPDVSQVPTDAPSLTIQPKLTINTPGDSYEQEADHMAEQALATPANSRTSDASAHIQRFSAPSKGQTDSAPASVENVVASPGRPLEPSLRQDMENRFGHDFNHVQIHTDSDATESARSVYARAYTVGSHIVFGAGEFSPSTEKGSKLLAHELAHTIQQRGGTAPLSSVKDAGNEVAHRSPLSSALPASGVRLACAPVPIDAYTDEMLAERLAEVRQRLKQKSYSDRDSDVDLNMALTWEADKRARAAAVIAAAPYLESTESPKDEQYKMPARFLPGGFTDADIYPGAKEKEIAEKKREEQQALARKREEEGRPARLNTVRRYFILHGVSRRNAADVLTYFLTVNDLRVLQKNGLEPPGFFTSHYGDKVVAVIDKIVPRNPIEDREDTEDLQRRAASIEGTGQKLEGLSTEGVHSLGGRILGAVVAYIAGKDPLAGSEVGAMFGGMLGVRNSLRYGRPSMTNSEREPIKPRVVEEEIAPPRETIPTPATTEPPLPEKPSLTVNRPIDVTKGGPFPASKVPPSTTSSRRETVEEFQKRGGNITKVPEGQSGSSKTPTRVKPDTTTARPTGLPSASDVDVVSQPGMRKQDRAYPSTPQHHVFPQELESWFKERFKGTSEDIHEYTVYISEGEHQAIHKTGKGSSVKGVQEPDLKGWNREWKDFKRDYPTASPQAIFEKAGQLMDKYKISGAEIARYKHKKANNGSGGE